MLVFNTDKTFELDLKANQHEEIVILLFGDQNYQTDIKVKLSGENANIKVTGLYFASDKHKIDNKIEIEHIAPNCTSNVLYKGVAKDSGSTVSWRGNVIINTQATGTSTYEENRNLLLTKGTKVISEPNLEILTGDIVGAGHASATSRFDEKELFYLQSRGIDKETAKKLVIHGFFYSVLDDLLMNKSVSGDLVDEIKQKIDELL